MKAHVLCGVEGQDVGSYGSRTCQEFAALKTDLDMKVEHFKTPLVSWYTNPVSCIIGPDLVSEHLQMCNVGCVE